MAAAAGAVRREVDSYVVHIFRRPGEGGESLVGLVERIGDGERQAFHDEAQLLEYLSRIRPIRRIARQRRTESGEG